MKDITIFVQSTLIPALYGRIDQAFPDMEFKQVRGDWHSPHKLDGTRTSRPDKSVVTHKVPSRILEQGGESISLVDFYMQRSHLDFIGAVRALASVCCIEVPESDPEGYRIYKEKQDKREALALQMERALFTEEGAATLRYLREVRGYSDELIKAMRLGYVSKAAASQMEGAPYGAGEIYTLAVPYRSAGAILGFKLRTIEEGIHPKYKNTSDLPKSTELFGLTGLRLTGNREKDRDLVIVEGEIDALRAQCEGVDNIVAAAGGDLSEEALRKAKDRGVKRITLLFDTDDTLEQKRKTTAKIEKAIRLAHSTGLSVLVARYEAPEGAKVDTDSYLKDHTVEDLRKVIDSAVDGSTYIYARITEDFIERERIEGGNSPKLMSDYKRALLNLLNDEGITSPTEREYLLQTIEGSLGALGLTREAFRKEANLEKEERNILLQTEKTRETLSGALDLVAKGNTTGAIDLLASKIGELKGISKETQYSKLLITPTSTEIREALRARPEGIATDYYFSKGEHVERLVFPSGALSLIAAPTSHGKSTFLRNVALQTAKGLKAGESVLYFTIEEDTESTVAEFVNHYVNEELTRKTQTYGNLTSITDYYRTDSLEYMRSDKRDTFKSKEAEFMEGYIASGKLRIFDTDFYAEEMVEAIRYLCARIKVKAVFVDYIQLLYKKGSRLQRNEELKEIAKGFREAAKELQIPIIAAAQLNREAKSPTEMHSQNIADSADLEREANKVILLWNCSFRPLNNSNYKETALEEIKRVKKEELGTDSYQAKSIYAILSKNRGGKPSIDALLRFNGNTGIIAGNEPTERNDTPNFMSLEEEQNEEREMREQEELDF